MRYTILTAQKLDCVMTHERDLLVHNRSMFCSASYCYQQLLHQQHVSLVLYINSVAPVLTKMRLVLQSFDTVTKTVTGLLEV